MISLIINAKRIIMFNFKVEGKILTLLKICRNALLLLKILFSRKCCILSTKEVDGPGRFNHIAPNAPYVILSKD